MIKLISDQIVKTSYITIHLYDFKTEIEFWGKCNISVELPYSHFKDATRQRRSRLEDARLFMYFKRDADELESWINEKLQTASDESYRDPTNLQVITA